MMLKSIMSIIILSTLLFGQGQYHSKLSDHNMLYSDRSMTGSSMNFELGIRDGITFMFVKVNEDINGYTNKIKTIVLPVNLHLTAGVSFLKNFKLDFRIGIMYLYEDFNGLDEGIFLEADLFGTNFYGTAGIDFYNNSQTGHGVTYYSESGGSTTFFSMGFGYHISRHFDLDITYFLPNNKVYGFDRIYNDNDTVQNYNKINNGIIFLGCQYSFIF